MRERRAALAVPPVVGDARFHARPRGVNSTLPVVEQIHCFSMSCTATWNAPSSVNWASSTLAPKKTLSHPKVRAASVSPSRSTWAP